jgi:hypothetical protein
MPEGLVLEDWQRDVLTAKGIDPSLVEQMLAAPTPAERPELHVVGTVPRFRGEPPRFAIDADCPCCGWPERYFATATRKFGCIKCTYTSDERNA